MRKKAIELTKLDTSIEKYLKDITKDTFCGFPITPIVEAEKRLQAKEQHSIAYFSMEYGLAPSIYHTFQTVNPIDNKNILSEHEVFSNIRDMDYYHYLPVKKIVDLPIYGGGLGVLAGDTLKSSADHGVPLVALGILWDKGYFKQKFWFRYGGQFPQEMSWNPESYPGLIPLKPKISLKISGNEIKLRLWKYFIYSYDLKKVVPLILLDAELEENPDYMRELTHQLYRSYNPWIKIAQRMILGIGGVKALEALGYSINTYHLNEGHAALAFVEKARHDDPEKIKGSFVYTCHTPVEAGHDRFSFHDLGEALGKEGTDIVRRYGSDEKNHELANFTFLALNTAKNVNGVARQHGNVMRLQFPNHRQKIQSITNGVHTHTWLSKPFFDLFAKYKDEIGDFEKDPTCLANVANLKESSQFREDLWNAHLANKKVLAEFLKFWFFKPHVFTLGWARRIALYKRPALLLHDRNRLVRIAKNYGQLQIVVAGKAHPEDVPASLRLDKMLSRINELNGEMKTLRICFLENYDTYFAKLLTNSVDVWLNNPLPPFEASGTSGMKAILNGVIQLSTVDGWMVEAADKNIGRTFGMVPDLEKLGSETDMHMKSDSEALYEKLEELIPLYYSTLKSQRFEKCEWIDMMINAIAQSAYFSTQRMVSEYKEKMWQI
jgi:starch phosphorylase